MNIVQTQSLVGSSQLPSSFTSIEPMCLIHELGQFVHTSAQFNCSTVRFERQTTIIRVLAPTTTNYILLKVMESESKDADGYDLMDVDTAADNMP